MATPDQGGVLGGTRVLDFSELVPGPNATRTLVGLGADVIKVERADGGDRMRHRTAMFSAENRGKRSIAVDLKSREGLAAVRELVTSVDVLVEGYRPGVMDRLGLGFEELIQLNPLLIYVSISGYGAFGPYRDLPGHDFQYLSYVGAIPKPSPQMAAEYVPTSLPVADMGSAIFAVLGVVLALLERQRLPDGFRGRHLDVSMADCALAMMEPRITEGAREPEGASALDRPGYGIYLTRDMEYVSIGALEDHFWQRLATCLELPELTGAGYETYQDRRKHFGTIEELLRGKLASMDQAEIVRLLRSNDVPVAPLNDLKQPLKDLHFIERGMVYDAATDPIPRVAEWPLALESFMDRSRLSPAPDLGEHTADVLRDAGLSDDVVRSVALGRS